VNEAVLESAAARVVDGVIKMVELTTKSRPAARQPSALCSYCPVRETCDEGTTWLANRNDGDNAPW
jgi:CRISPR/Cas system-associated exonuclease Cas4 (RecB family)